MKNTMNKEIKTIFADPGYCFANKQEDQIFYVCVWGDEETLGMFHQIPLKRAKEIVSEYRRKYCKYFYNA